MKIKIFLLSILLASLNLAYSAEKPAENQCRSLVKSAKYAEAFPICKKLAEQGNDVAQIVLGVMYSDGNVVAQDPKQAINWFTKSAEQGDVFAQYMLGNIYNMGGGVPKDYKQSFSWYSKAAEQGDSTAQNSLGDMYSEGQGVPKDYKQAYAWYSVASVAKSSADGSRDSVAKKLSKDELEQAQDLAIEYYKKYGSSDKYGY